MAHTVYMRHVVLHNFLMISNYGKHSLNHRHAAHSVYEIYSVFKLFEIAVCFAHFDFFEISTPVMLIMLTMANIV